MNLLNRLDLFTTEEGPESEDNTYLGYSLTLGHFNGDAYPDIAVGIIILMKIGGLESLDFTRKGFSSRK